MEMANQDADRVNGIGQSRARSGEWNPGARRPRASSGQRGLSTAIIFFLGSRENRLSLRIACVFIYRVFINDQLLRQNRIRISISYSFLYNF